MVMTVSFKKVRTSKRLTEYAEEHLAQKLEKQLGHPLKINVRFSTENGMSTVVATATSPDGFRLTARHSAEMLYEAIDRTAEKLIDQWATHKGKVISRRSQKKGNLLTLPLNTVDAEVDEELGEMDSEHLI